MALNAKGGLSGRTIKPLFVAVDSQGDYQTQAVAACATFTQDNHVAAVLDNGNYVDAGFEACLTKASVPHMVDAFATGDARLLADNPGIVSAVAPSLDRQVQGVISSLRASGYLTPRNKLGVVYEDCPQTTRAYNEALRPAAARAGVAVAGELRLSCVHGFSDAGPAAAAISNAILAFRRAGVDRVTFISSFEATLALLFANAAEGQQYRPGYVLSSAAGPSLLGPQIPAAQAANLHGMGWLPATDASLGKQPTATEAGRRCLNLYVARGVKPATTTDQYYMGADCDGMFLLERALQATHGVSRGPDLVRAIEALRGAYGGVSALGGSNRFGKGRHDGPALVREWRWDNGCSCTSYIGRSAGSF